MTYPLWLCPPAPPATPGRQVKFLDPLPPEVDPAGLKAYRQIKRAEHLARIKAMGLTEREYVRMQKAKQARKRREAVRTKSRKDERRDFWKNKD